MKLTEQQEKYFAESKIRDSKGNLVTLYHGSGTEIKSFDPAFTGQGNDQFGSGFYFTTCYTTASGYSKEGRTSDEAKIGGSDNPNVIKAYVNVTKPILIDGRKESNLGGIHITKTHAKKIIEYLPSLYVHPDESDPYSNVLWDYYDLGDYTFNSKEDYTRLGHKMINDSYKEFNPTLLDMDVLFKDFPTELRTALRAVLKSDGVVVRFDKSKHVIAWFPEQIKDVRNLNPQNSSSLLDGTQVGSGKQTKGECKMKTVNGGVVKSIPVKAKNLTVELMGPGYSTHADNVVSYYTGAKTGGKVEISVWGVGVGDMPFMRAGVAFYKTLDSLESHKYNYYHEDNLPEKYNDIVDDLVHTYNTEFSGKPKLPYPKWSKYLPGNTAAAKPVEKKSQNTQLVEAALRAAGKQRTEFVLLANNDKFYSSHKTMKAALEKRNEGRGQLRLFQRNNGEYIRVP